MQVTGDAEVEEGALGRSSRLCSWSLSPGRSSVQMEQGEGREEALGKRSPGLLSCGAESGSQRHRGRHHAPWRWVLPLGLPDGPAARNGR